MQTFIEAQHAAELAVLAMAVRAVLARAAVDEPAVVSMAVLVTFDGRWQTVAVEYLDSTGLAVGGFTL